MVAKRCNNNMTGQLGHNYSIASAMHNIGRQIQELHKSAVLVCDQLTEVMHQAVYCKAWGFGRYEAHGQHAGSAEALCSINVMYERLQTLSPQHLQVGLGGLGQETCLASQPDNSEIESDYHKRVQDS